MPQLVKQAMLGRDQPRQQRRVERRALARFGKQPLDGDKAVVLRRQGQRPVQAQGLAAEGATAGIAEVGPDLIEDHLQLIADLAIGTDQAPTQLRRIGFREVAKNPVTRGFSGTQALGRVEKTAHPAPLLADVENTCRPLGGKPSRPASAPSKRISHTPRNAFAKRCPALSATSKDASPG